VIDTATQDYDKQVVVLSERSNKSSWVEDEVDAALEQEGRPAVSATGGEPMSPAGNGYRGDERPSEPG
jgi:hypothetical protein